MLWGALAQSLPDIDFVAGFWMPLSQELLAHRGFTHSLLFLVLVTPVLAVIASRMHGRQNIALKTWLLFFGTEVLVHIFLDGFNNYGTGWLEPFSHHRFSFNTLYVADPFFSIWAIIAALALLVISVSNSKRKWWMRLGMLVPALYLVYAGINKIRIDQQTREALAQQQIPYSSYFTTPAPLNNWLWYVVAGNDSGFYVGFRSIFDRQPSLQLEYFPRNKFLLDSLWQDVEVQQLVRFSQGFYTVENLSDSLVFNDLRFGQIIGWKAPREQFVFHYYLQHPDNNELVVQRGRFAKWDKEIALALLRRAMGNSLVE